MSSNTIGFDELMKDLLEDDDELKRELELLNLKYQLIDQVIEFRKKNGLTQSEFAELINVKQQMISRFELGNVDPRLSFVAKLLNGMKMVISFSDKEYIKADSEIHITSKPKVKLDSKEINND